MLQRSAHAPVPGAASRSAAEGLALTQEPCGVTLRGLARREERSRGTDAGRATPVSVMRTSAWGGSPWRCEEPPQGSAGAANAAYRQERQAIRKAPVRGYWGREKSAARAERSGAGAFRVCPLGGGGRGKGAASIGVLLPRPGGQERRLAAQRSAGAVQRRRLTSRCTDRSAGGCADRRTDATTRARALRGLDTAEAAPRRCASWRSRGRRWRGPLARATERLCRISAVQGWSADCGAAWCPLETARTRATAADHSAAPVAGSAGEGRPVPLPGQTAAAMTEHAPVLALQKLSTMAGENDAHGRTN